MQRDAVDSAMLDGTWLAEAGPCASREFPGSGNPIIDRLRRLPQRRGDHDPDPL